jgi:osmoprotectant transport system ATP-binding protein
VPKGRFSLENGFFSATILPVSHLGLDEGTLDPRNANMVENTSTPATAIEFLDTGYLIQAAEPRPILNGISLRIADGELIAILGRSGSGKTSLLKLINRTRAFTSGNVLVGGQSVAEWDLIRLRRGIGYVIQETGLFPHLTVEENACIVPRLEKWPADRARRRFHEVMELVGLNADEFGQRYPRELSGGQRQRVGIARALAADPRILLMDEPFGALDPITRAELQQVFLDLARRVSKTIVLVTHDLREALLLGTRIVLLKEGRIEASASPHDFLQLDQPAVREFVAASELRPGQAV